MTPVEHFALSLVFFGLTGFLVGVAKGTLEEYKRGNRTALDLLYVWGFFFAIGYGLAGFQFVDGRYFIWIIPLLFAISSARLGRALASSRKDLSVALPIVAVYIAVPALFHFIL